MDSELIKRKLDNPAAVLTIDESTDVLDFCVKLGAKELLKATSCRAAIAVIGNTGAGKSTCFNYLHGCTMEQIKRKELGLTGGGSIVRVAASSNPAELFAIGHQ